MTAIAKILRHVVVIGMLPRSKVRAALVDDYAGEEATTTLIPAGMATEADLRVADIEALTDVELVAFLKGAALILGPSLRRETHCICNMRGCVIWPVAAYATLLRRDVGRARKAWKAFAEIPRLCAERLPFGHPVDLRAIEFEEFVLRLSADQDMEERTFATRAAAAAKRLTELFELARR